MTFSSAISSGLRGSVVWYFGSGRRLLRKDMIRSDRQKSVRSAGLSLVYGNTLESKHEQLRAKN